MRNWIPAGAAMSVFLALCGIAHAQPGGVQTSGTVIVIPADGEVTRANDEAHATFAVEEQDRDKAAAASRVNQKMKQGVEVLKRADPKAKLQTRGYYTYPVYEETPPNVPPKQRRIVGWRVGQYVDLTTTSLDTLPATVAAAQKVLTLNGLYFGLSRPALRELDRERIGAAYRNLNDRIAFVLQAMGRGPADATIDTIDFEGSGNYVPQAPAPAAMRSLAAKAPADSEIAEPSFEPGETTLSMRVVGRVKVR
jgi:uncharacterized protein YggE